MENNEKQSWNKILWILSPLHKEQVAAIKTFVTGIKRKFDSLPKKYKTSAAVGLALLVSLGTFYELSNANKAYAVMVNGHKISIVKAEEQARTVLNQVINEKTKEIGQKVETSDNIAYVKTKAKNIQLDGNFNLKRKLNNTLAFVTTGTAIEVNGENKAVVLNKKTARKVLDELAKSYLANYKNVKIEKVDYLDKISLPDKKINIKKIISEQDAVSLLRQGRAKKVTYKVAKGDSIWSIARKNDMYIRDIQAANPGLNIEKLKPDQEINLVKAEPMLNLRIYAKGTATETIAFDIKTQYDPNMNSGQQKIKEQGEAGSKEVTYHLVLTNDNVETKDILAQNITKPPKTQVVTKGSRVIASRGWTGGGSGMLAWPVRGPIPRSGYFNSYRGGRMHSALDIDAPTGTAVGAASNGVVIFRGWDSGYGNCILIDHGNGIVTRYAHLSGYNTSVGASVSRGQIIGYVGSTGYSTGPHLHFEVIVNGRRVDPLGYL